MASGGPNLECRMYESKYPEVDMTVMIQVTGVPDTAAAGAYVSLFRRVRSISSTIKVGRIEVVTVIRVQKDKGYVDLSKRGVSEEDIVTCNERYNKSKLVHSILRNCC